MLDDEESISLMESTVGQTWKTSAFCGALSGDSSYTVWGDPNKASWLAANNYNDVNTVMTKGSLNDQQDIMVYFSGAWSV